MLRRRKPRMSELAPVNITLDEQRAAKLALLAARVHVDEGTLARSLLSSALDDADPDVDNIVTLLDAVDGAFDRAVVGRQQAVNGDTVSLADL
jgi:hypothetical protein